MKRLFSDNSDISNLKKYVEKAYQMFLQSTKQLSRNADLAFVGGFRCEISRIYFTNLGGSAILVGTELRIEQITN